MPNHVTNSLIISGVSAERLEEIRNAIHRVEEGVDEFDGKPYKTDRAIDFNAILPMPPEMHITSGGMTDYGMVHLHPKMIKHTFISSLQEAEDRLNKLSDKDKEKALKEGEQAYQNIKKHGCKDWYAWATHYWGTKWNAYDIQVVDSPDRLEIQFDTAWATPYPVMQKLSEMFPDATVSVTYADEDIGHNCGRYSFLNGEETEVYQPEGGSDEAMTLAIEVKGMQDELVKDEATGEWKWVSEMEDVADTLAEMPNEVPVEGEDTVGDALNTLVQDGVVTTHDDHTAEIENDAEAKANEG